MSLQGQFSQRSDVHAESRARNEAYFSTCVSFKTADEMMKSEGPDWQRVLGYVESIYRHFEMWPLWKVLEFSSWFFWSSGVVWKPFQSSRRTSARSVPRAGFAFELHRVEKERKTNGNGDRSWVLVDPKKASDIVMQISNGKCLGFVFGLFLTLI